MLYLAGLYKEGAMQGVVVPQDDVCTCSLTAVGLS